MRKVLWATLLVLAIGSAATAEASITLLGSFKVSTALGCQTAPECAAFTRTCAPPLALRDGVTSSIADVSAVRGAPARVTASWISLGRISALSIQFYSAQCQPVADAMMWSPGSMLIAIPQAARWMTVTGAFAADVEWSLTR
jgi:hypothetical protein